MPATPGSDPSSTRLRSPRACNCAWDTLRKGPSPLEQPIRRALESTAAGLGLEPEELLAEFDRHWTFRPNRQQKGVDTLIALDMVRLAGRSVCATMVLVAGDRDFAEVVRASQDFGTRVLVATPEARQRLARGRAARR